MRISRRADVRALLQPVAPPAQSTTPGACPASTNTRSVFKFTFLRAEIGGVLTRLKGRMGAFADSMQSTPEVSI